MRTNHHTELDYILSYASATTLVRLQREIEDRANDDTTPYGFQADLREIARQIEARLEELNETGY